MEIRHGERRNGDAENIRANTYRERWRKSVKFL